MIAAQPVGHRVFSESEESDAHGNPVDSLAEPVEVLVYAIAPRFATEPDPTRGAEVVGLNLLAPVGTVIGPHDVVVIDGEDYEVDGETADWTRGPFDWAPGVSINLKKAEG